METCKIICTAVDNSMMILLNVVIVNVDSACPDKFTVHIPLMSVRSWVELLIGFFVYTVITLNTIKCITLNVWY